jgi:short-subunit dehydrogenase
MGKNALITGASAGLGLELARLFARDNHSVILVARRLARLEEIAEQLRKQHPAIRVDVLAMHLGTPGAGSELFREIESRGLQVDFLVNNAGFGNVGLFAELPVDRQLQMIDLNIRTLVELTRLILPAMLSRRSGHILNVGSIAGFQPGPNMAVYYATKAFVNSFSEALHEELRGTGVSCTVLAPGPTATEFEAIASESGMPIFRLPGMVTAAAPTADDGYRAMMKGRALVVSGFTNKMVAQLNRVVPRFFVRRLAGALNSSRGR